GGPPYLKLLQIAEEYASVTVKTMVDQGATYGADSSNKVRKWEIIYDGLTAAQAATLDTHYKSAVGQLLGFDFTDPQTTTLYTDTHYLEYSRDHSKVWSQSRKVTLIKRPA